ncbi:MAG: hypothetical protein WCK05_13670 [Planctomycetota bacterium]|jgi:hypothetical protein
MTTPLKTIRTLDEARQLIKEGKPQDALDMLARHPEGGPEILNMRGVCLLRTGKASKALDLFRPLVFPGGFCLDTSAPLIYLTNYATALLLVGNVLIACETIAQVPDQRHEAVLRLRGALARWKNGLNFFRRILLPLGLYPDVPVELDSPIGDI